MSHPALKRWFVLALSAAAFAGPLIVDAETPPAPAASVPKSASPPATGTQPEELQWTEEGASARCRDGSYFHGNPRENPCAGHGGVQKRLAVPGQDLIR